jgi:hypothetical protein
MIFRRGTTGTALDPKAQETWRPETPGGASGQFWSLKNPLTTPNYSKIHGLPSEGQGYRWIMGGRLKPGTPSVTGTSQGIGPNPGGAMEVVTPPGAVRIQFFHMPD